MPLTPPVSLTGAAGSVHLRSVLFLTALAEILQPHTVPSVTSCPLSSSSDSLTQGNFFQQVEVALKEVITNGFVKDEGHAVSTEFIVGLLPAGSKRKMGSQVGHAEGAAVIPAEEGGLPGCVFELAFSSYTNLRLSF